MIRSSGKRVKCSSPTLNVSGPRWDGMSPSMSMIAAAVGQTAEVEQIQRFLRQMRNG